MQKSRKIIGFIMDDQTKAHRLEVTTVQIFALLYEALKPTKTMQARVDVWIEGMRPGELPEPMDYTPHFCVRGELEESISKVQKEEDPKNSFSDGSFAIVGVGSRAFCAARVHLWSELYDAHPRWALHLLRRIGTVPDGYCGWINLENLETSSYPIESLVRKARAKAKAS